MSNEIITPKNAKRAHRRRLPAVLKEINAKLRDGGRLFMVTSDYPEGLYPMVLAAFRRQKGWTIDTLQRTGTIRVSLPGEPRNT